MTSQNSCYEGVSTPKISWESCVGHLSDRELCIRLKSGSIQNFWRLDTTRKELVPLNDHHGKITGYGVWLWAYMNTEYPREIKMRSISELLKLNPN